MKLSLALIALLTSANAFAVEDAGCGLGNVIWKGNNGKLAQIFAATTNGTSGSQTFGITTGTSNCTSKGLVRAEKEQEYFANVNRDALYNEMAQGQGENLSALGILMGCSEASLPAFQRLAQTKYTNLFPAAETKAIDMIQALRIEVASDPELARSCTFITPVQTAQNN